MRLTSGRWIDWSFKKRSLLERRKWCYEWGSYRRPKIRGGKGCQVVGGSRTRQGRGFVRKAQLVSSILFCFCFSPLVLGGLSKTVGAEWTAQVR